MMQGGGLSPWTNDEGNTALTAHQGRWSWVRREKTLMLFSNSLISEIAQARVQERGIW